MNMKNPRQFGAGFPPFRATKLAAAILCTAFCSTMILVGNVQADTVPAQASPNEPSQKATVEVRGQKVPVGPHCVYTNFATLPVESSDGLLSVDGDLDGRHTHMALDTGALHTVLTVEEAEKLGLKLQHSRLTDTDTNGDLTATYATYVDHLSLDKLGWHGVKFGVMSHVADSYSAVAGADILLNGLEKDIEFALGTQQVRFFEPSAECRDAFLAYWDDNALTAPLVDLSPQDPRQVVTVTINGKEMTALIDSGVPTSVITLEAAAKVGITPQSAGVNELTSSNGFEKQQGKTWLASFQSFTIGGETIKNPRIGIADLWGTQPLEPGFRSVLRATTSCTQSPGNGMQACIMGQLSSQGGLRSELQAADMPDMLLGADFLRSHRVLLAISQRRMYYSYLGGQVFGRDAKQTIANGFNLGANTRASAN
jgi:predicted aspartyl protease